MEPASDDRSAVAALALLAWGFALLGTTVLVVSEVWLEPRPWVWPAVVLAYACAAAAFLGLSKRTRIDEGEARALDADDATRSAHEASAADGMLYGRSGGLLALGDPVRSVVARYPLRAACVALSLAVAASAVIMLNALGDGRPVRDYWTVFGIWLAGILLYAIGLAGPDRPAELLKRRWRVSPRPTDHALGLAESEGHAAPRFKNTYALDVAALVAISILLRVTLLSSIPNLLTGDEGVFGNASEWMSRGEGSHMFGTYWANASLYFVPHAALIRVLGPTILAIRLPGALAAAFAPAATYALGRAAFSRRVGLAAGAFVMASHMHVHVSRMGLGHGLDALFSAVALWGLYRAFTLRDVRAATLAGVALGMAQYGYVGARMIDLVAVVIVVGLWITASGRSLFRGRPFAEAIKDAVPPGPLLAAVGASLVTAGPMIRWAIVRTDDYMSRLNTEGLVQSGRADAMLGEIEGPLALALVQVRDAALAFVGAPAVQFYFTSHPMITVLWASLFVLGFALAVRRVGETRFLMPLAHVLVAGTVLALASNTSTAAYRITGVIPSIAILAAVALFALIDAAHGMVATSQARRMPAVLVSGLIVGFELWAYFGSFAPGCGYWGRPSAITSAAGTRIGPPGMFGAVFALARPEADLGAFESVSYLTGRKVEPMASSPPPEGASDPEAPVPERTIWDVLPGESPANIEAKIGLGPKPVLVIAVPDRTTEFESLLELHPDARAGSNVWCGELVLSWFEVDAETP